MPLAALLMAHLLQPVQTSGNSIKVPIGDLASNVEVLSYCIKFAIKKQLLQQQTPIFAITLLSKGQHCL
jgi:hypothetical protein